MSLRFESSSESTWLGSSVIFMFSFFFLFFIVLSLCFTPSFSPLGFFSFLAAGGEDTSIREGGRWNRDSRYQSMVMCIVDTHVTHTVDTYDNTTPYPVHYMLGRHLALIQHITPRPLQLRHQVCLQLPPQMAHSFCNDA